MAYFTGTVLASPIVNGSSGDTYGTHYSVLGVGGYQEVSTLAQRNAIPVNAINGLDSDGLSSGRRRLGMLVYVSQTNIVYQLNITYPAWNALSNTNKVLALANNANWIEFSSGGMQGNSESVSKTILQFNHGFNIGNAVAYSGSSYVKAIADGSLNGEAIGIVSFVYDINTFTLVQSGYVSGLTGLTTNSTYYVSDVTAGILTTTEPTTIGNVTQPMLIADSSMSGWVVSYRPLIITSGGTGGNEYYTLSTPAAISVGGITIGTVLTGKTYGQLFEEMLVPELCGTITAPSTGIGLSASGLYEIGCVVSETVTGTFNRGSISPQYCSVSAFRSGCANAYCFTGTGMPSGFQLCALSTASCTNATYPVVIGTQSWGVCTRYDAGSPALSNKGNQYCAALVSGSTSAASGSIVGVYPLYGTTSTITVLTKQTLVAMTTGNNICMNLAVESGGNKQKFEVPCAWLSAPTNRPLVGVCQWNTVSSQWEYPGGSAGASLTLWTSSSASETVQGSPIGYCQYTYNGVDRSSVCIRLVF